MFSEDAVAMGSVFYVFCEHIVLAIAKSSNSHTTPQPASHLSIYNRYTSATGTPHGRKRLKNLHAKEISDIESHIRGRKIHRRYITSDLHVYLWQLHSPSLQPQLRR